MESASVPAAPVAPDQRAKALRMFGGTRAAIGIGSWLAPSLSSKAFGLGPIEQPMIGQLFGARELALGLLTAAGTGKTQTTALKVGIAIDIADAVASLRNYRSLSPMAKLGITAGAPLFAAIGAALLKSAPEEA